MTKKQSYVPRLILFGNKFKHDTSDLFGGIVEEFDLSNDNFGTMEEANILFEYLFHFKGSYSKAQVIYAYDKRGLVFHHMHMEGPCFELKNQNDVRKLKSKAKLIDELVFLEELSQRFSQVSAAICTKVKYLPNITNKKTLNSSAVQANESHQIMLKNAKQALIEYMTANFAV